MLDTLSVDNRRPGGSRGRAPLRAFPRVPFEGARTRTARGTAEDAGRATKEKAALTASDPRILPPSMPRTRRLGVSEFARFAAGSREAAAADPGPSAASLDAQCAGALPLLYTDTGTFVACDFRRAFVAQAAWAAFRRRCDGARARWSLPMQLRRQLLELLCDMGDLRGPSRGRAQVAIGAWELFTAFLDSGSEIAGFEALHAVPAAAQFALCLLTCHIMCSKLFDAEPAFEQSAWHDFVPKWVLFDAPTLVAAAPGGVARRPAAKESASASGGAALDETMPLPPSKPRTREARQADKRHRRRRVNRLSCDLLLLERELAALLLAVPLRCSGALLEHFAFALELDEEQRRAALLRFVEGFAGDEGRPAPWLARLPWERALHAVHLALRETEDGRCAARRRNEWQRGAAVRTFGALAGLCPGDARDALLAMDSGAAALRDAFGGRRAVDMAPALGRYEGLESPFRAEAEDGSQEFMQEVDAASRRAEAPAKAKRKRAAPRAPLADMGNRTAAREAAEPARKLLSPTAHAAQGRRGAQPHHDRWRRPAPLRV